VRILRYFISAAWQRWVDIGFFLLFANLAGFNYLVVAPLGVLFDGYRDINRFCVKRV
jgi:hypothetical protein